MTEQGQNTAIVRTNPDADIAVQQLYAEAAKLLVQADAMVVATEAHVAIATDKLTLISKLKKALQEKRKEFVDPLQAYVKSINEVFKTMGEPVELADQTLRAKVSQYRQEQDRKRREIQEINRLKQEAAQRESELKGQPAEPVELVPEPSPAPTRSTTEGGTLGQRRVPKWRLLDITKVPVQYLMVDNGRVTKAVKAGIGSIPGIEIYYDTLVTVEANPHKAVPDAPDAPF